MNANLLLLKCVPTYYFDTDEIFYVTYSTTALQKNVTQLGHWFNARAALPLSIVSQKLGIFHNNQAFYRQKGGGKTVGRKNSNPYLGNDSQIEALVTNFSAPTTTATSSTTALQHANSGKQQFFFFQIPLLVLRL